VLICPHPRGIEHHIQDKYIVPYCSPFILSTTVFVFAIL
jgi:hypothetical protein